MANDKPFLICAHCQYDETKFPVRYWHIMALHAALDHGVNLREIYRSKRVEAPSHTVTWRLPNGTGWAIELVEQTTLPGKSSYSKAIEKFL